MREAFSFSIIDIDTVFKSINRIKWRQSEISSNRRATRGPVVRTAGTITPSGVRIWLSCGTPTAHFIIERLDYSRLCLSFWGDDDMRFALQFGLQQHHLDQMRVVQPNWRPQLSELAQGSCSMPAAAVVGL
jgi:hypothetical protein